MNLSRRKAITLIGGGTVLESLMALGLLSREAQADPASTGFRQGLEI